MRRTVPHKLSLAFIHIYMYALRSCCQAIKRSAKQEENPLFTVPDRCRVIVPCEIVSGQITTTASRNLLFWQQFALLWKGFPFLTLLFTFSWRFLVILASERTRGSRLWNAS